MATALQLPAPDTGPAFSEASAGLPPLTHINGFPSHLSVAELDLKDTRYPTLGSSAKPVPGPAMSIPTYIEQPVDAAVVDGTWASRVESPNPRDSSPKSGAMEKAEDLVERQVPQEASLTTKQQAQSPNAGGTLPTYAGPSGSPPRLVELLTRDEPLQRRPSRGGSSEFVRIAELALAQQDMGQRASLQRQQQEQHGALAPSSPRHPALPPSPRLGVSSGGSPNAPIVPLSSSPVYGPSAVQVHISPKPRASAQYPTYITPAQQPSTMNARYVPAQRAPREEICVECAMRDEDMADVDVTSPGVWDRESDVLYEELIRREREEEITGVYHPESSTRPRSQGHPLSEDNLRLWLTMNPKEPSSRQQTLDSYVKAQRSLLEADALAHARAMREARLLEERMRDTYSQLRRSAYELGSSAQAGDEASGGVRIKPPRSTSMPTTAALAVPPNEHSREVTLLENGMIVEHVDVRKEEKEDRERKRKEERRDRSRARKSSRGSAIDVASVYSMPIPGQRTQTDSSFFSVRGSESRYSQSFSLRPSSVLTTGGERSHLLPRAYSQASFSDMQSIGSSTSPRRSRFLGFKNLSSGWRSQESFAPSGSMMDMHLALQNEQYYISEQAGEELGSNTPTLRAGEGWAPEDIASRTETPATLAPKKKNGFKKIWKIVTGSSKNSSSRKGRTPSRSLDRTEDDTPLAPPPPLSYLVDRERGVSSRRHVSTPSLPSSMSPNTMSAYAPSPPTAPSSIIPSPSSSRHPVNDRENGSDHRKDSGNLEHENEQATPPETNSPDSETRGRPTQSSSKTLSSIAGPQTPPAMQSLHPHAVSLRRDKSLPPLPGDDSVEFPSHPVPEPRPQTIFTYDHMPRSAVDSPFGGPLLPPQAPFRTADQRRQSFGGLGSQPHPAVRSMPSKGIFGRVTPGPVCAPPFLAEETYGEFGASRLSLSQWESSRGTQRSRDSNAKVKQRRSKFALSSLFGKKTHASEEKEKEKEKNNSQSDIEYTASGFRSSGSDRDDLPNPYSSSAHSASAPRMPMVSRKNIAELVDQDPDFLAYRYPSMEQRLDLH